MGPLAVRLGTDGRLVLILRSTEQMRGREEREREQIGGGKGRWREHRRKAEGERKAPAAWSSPGRRRARCAATHRFGVLRWCGAVERERVEQR